MTVFSKAMVALLLVFITATVHAQVLFTYGGKPVTKNEFLKAYRKNNNESKPTDQSYSDYLELFIRFKLKVQAALAMKLDTMSNQQAELRSFRNQVVENYVNDDESINEMIEEAIARGKKDIHIAHIFVAVKKGATEQEIKQASDKINAAWSQLQKGQDFGKVAAEFSEDPSVSSNKGDIGYITSLILPYELENTVYNTAPGKFSAPVRSKVGFHIFKNLGEREALGRMKAAQILVSFPPGANEEQKQETKKRADSIYNVLIKGGSDFKAMAAKFSSDNLTWQAGGEMMEFGVGQYDLPFETAAFALKKDGDISEPVLTSYGYHIIKRLQRKPVINDTTKARRDEVKQRILQSDRLDVAKQRMLKKVLQLTGYKKHAFNLQHFQVYTDSVLQKKKAPKFADMNDKTALFSFAKQTITVKDWQTYLETIRDYENMKAGKTDEQLLDQFVESSAFDYYRNHMEEYNKEFAYQLNEFKEGNLLFEVMQRKVWDVASTDTAGLKKYYSAHKDKYWWEGSADAIIFTASNETVADDIRKKVKENYKNWQKYIDNSSGQLQGDSGRFELNQIPVVEKTNFTEGLITANVKNNTDKSVAFAYIVKLHPDKEPRNFADARGFVINDYQGYLEEQWIKELKKKYPVKINTEVVKSLPK